MIKKLCASCFLLLAATHALALDWNACYLVNEDRRTVKYSVFMDRKSDRRTQEAAYKAFLGDALGSPHCWTRAGAASDAAILNSLNSEVLAAYQRRGYRVERVGYAR
jgi:hypothetical protein